MTFKRVVTEHVPIAAHLLPAAWVLEEFNLQLNSRAAFPAHLRARSQILRRSVAELRLLEDRHDPEVTAPGPALHDCAAVTTPWSRS